MACTDRPLNSEERAEITRLLGNGLKKIGADRAVSPTQGKIQELIGQAIESYRKLGQPLSDAMLEHLSKTLGCLLGQVICDEFGWTWALIKKDGGDECCGVVTPSRSHVVYPLQFVHDLLRGTSSETGSIPLYHRILTGQIPDSQDHGYVEL